MSWSPSPADIAWTRQLIATLKTGGLWAYREIPLIVLRKEEANTLAIINADESDPHVARQIERLTRVCAAGRITLIDQRPAPAGK